MTTNAASNAEYVLSEDVNLASTFVKLQSRLEARLETLKEIVGNMNTDHTQDSSIRLSTSSMPNSNIQTSVLLPQSANEQKQRQASAPADENDRSNLSIGIASSVGADVTLPDEDDHGEMVRRDKSTPDTMIQIEKIPSNTTPRRRKAATSRKSSKFRGVESTMSGKWGARLLIQRGKQRKSLWLGSFETELEAAKICESPRCLCLLLLRCRRT